MDVFSYRTITLLCFLIMSNLHSQVADLQEVTLYSDELKEDKRVWILLPEGSEAPQKRYPVLYLHDAQNLFDRDRSYAGEWKVDETMSELNLPFIVIGIEHGNEKRIDELTPYKHQKYGGGKGPAYAEFIINTLKPKIDSLYPTLPQREHTFIGGSSLGGLISHYMLFTYPDTFSGGIIFSPSYWFSEEIYTLTESASREQLPAIYMATGGREPESMVPDHNRMETLLRAKGMDEHRLKAVIRKDAEHNEAFWSAEFPEAMHWLHTYYRNSER